jgi:L-rhamnose mutarotase
MNESDRRRICFQLQLKPERLSEYRERHAAVWTEMLCALKHADWNNYSIFVRDDGLLIGYFETSDLAAAQTAMASTAVYARWQASMAEFFEEPDDPAPDSGFLVLDEVFNLEGQLATHAAADSILPNATQNRITS